MSQRLVYSRLGRKHFHSSSRNKMVEFQDFSSRRSVVHSTEGMIACTQPLAARCGLKVLAAGGNAAVSPTPPLAITY
jgi:hypothetical protein